MFPRFALFAAALLASAALQARTPEVAVLDDHFRPTSCGGMLAMPASCSLPTDSLSFSKRLMVDRLQLEPLAPVSQPRHAINFTVGNEIGGIYGYFLALEYSQRVKGAFWLGGLAHVSFSNAVKLYEMNM